MKHKIITFFKKKFIRNVMLIASGTAMAQIITFILLPIITRLYGPEAYGIMGTFIAIIAIITPIAGLALPTAIVIPKNELEAIGIIRTSLKVIFGMSLLSIVILLLFYEEIIDLLNLTDINLLLYFIPIVILLGGSLDIMRQWLIRNKQFNLIARANVIQPIIIYGGMAFTGIFYPAAIVLIVFSVMKSGVEALIMYIAIRNPGNPIKIRLKKSSHGFKDTLKKYHDFPKYRAPEVFISAVSQNLPVLLLTSLVGATSAGFYALGRMVLSVPGQLIGKAVGDVFYPRIAEASNNRENLSHLIIRATITLVVVGIIPYGVVTLLGPILFSIVFGEEWKVAGEYARWISVMTFAMFVSRPAVHALPVIRAQKFHLVFTITMTLVRLTSMYTGFIYFDNAYIAVALFSCSSAVLYIILIFITIYISNNFMKEY